MSLCRAVGAPRWTRPLLASAALVGFVVLARPEPSVLRAAVMGAVGLAGMSLSRRGAGLPALSAAVIVLLCADPWLARSYGFALSTLATLGLLLFAEPWGRWLARRLPGRWQALGQAVAIPVAAQAMCAPVVVLLQGSVTVIGVLANVLAAPLVAPATIAGVVVALLAVPLPPLAGLLAWVAAAPAGAIAVVAHTLAEVPMGTMPWPAGAMGALLLAALTIGAVLTAPWAAAQARRRPWWTLALGALAVIAVWPVPQRGWPAPGWRFVACDVGQGDALVVATGQGRAVVVDAGPSPDLVRSCLDRLEVSVVEALILTHYHADHVGGVDGVLAGREVISVLATPVAEPASMAAAVAARCAQAGLAVRALHAGDMLRWDTVTAEVLWPARRITSGSVPNNASVVVAVRAPGLHAVLLGDVEREAAAAIRSGLAVGGGPDPVDLVKVAHHG
jgi:competence protein ComEC